MALTRAYAQVIWGLYYLPEWLVHFLVPLGVIPWILMCFAGYRHTQVRKPEHESQMVALPLSLWARIAGQVQASDRDHQRNLGQPSEAHLNHGEAMA